MERVPETFVVFEVGSSGLLFSFKIKYQNFQTRSISLECFRYRLINKKMNMSYKIQFQFTIVHS